MCQVKYILFFMLVGLIGACGDNNLISTFNNDLSLDSVSNNIAKKDDVVPDICPSPSDYTPKVSLNKVKEEDEEGFEDLNRPFKDNATDIVNEYFFQTEPTLFNFMKLVYTSIENSLNNYAKEKFLEKDAVFLLFKGGNVLRMVARSAFDLMPDEASTLLEGQYAKYFTRSDADFSVYVDETKLNGAEYNKTLDEVTELVYKQLSLIREEFNTDPQKYFDFMRFRADFASKALSKYLNFARAIVDSIESEEQNKKWYGANIKQIQLLNYQAAEGPSCYYDGAYDKRYEKVGNLILTTRLTDKPSWIVNTDNRNIEGTWGTDTSKIVKFRLVRSKVNFVMHVENAQGEFLTKNAAGELIDVSIPERVDARLREFLDNIDHTVAEYTLTNKDNGNSFTMKAYSLSNLAEDLQFIIFDSFKRPWEHAKYFKRVNRLFFLMILELVNNYGIGSDRANEYLADVEEKILNLAQNIYPLGEKSSSAGEQMIYNAELLSNSWKNLQISNEFWVKFANFVNESLIKSPLEGDEEGFTTGITNDKGTLDPFLKTVKDNIEVMKKLGKMPFIKINLNRIYNPELEDIH